MERPFPGPSSSGTAALGGRKFDGVSGDCGMTQVCGKVRELQTHTNQNTVDVANLKRQFLEEVTRVLKQLRTSEASTAPPWPDMATAPTFCRVKEISLKDPDDPKPALERTR